MELLIFKLKSGIKIKPSHKGLFTAYCHGKVTDECILKGKNSSNPAIRKRATFADNAKHFKHKSGGKAFVNGVSILDSNPNAYKYVKKRYKMHLYGGEIINDSPIVTSHLNWIQEMSDYLLKKRELDKLKKELELLKKLQESDMISNILGTAFNYGMDYFANKALSKNRVPTSKNNKAGSDIISGPPESSNETFTSKIGLTGTIDEWRKAMQV